MFNSSCTHYGPCLSAYLLDVINIRQVIQLKGLREERKSSANYLLDDDRFGSGWFSELEGLVEFVSKRPHSN